LQVAFNILGENSDFKFYFFSIPSPMPCVWLVVAVFFFATAKEKALVFSAVDLENIKAEAGETFMTCRQCGACTSLCPSGAITSYSPRMILRSIALDRPPTVTVDEVSWTCKGKSTPALFHIFL
jgi:ferredoxin